MNHRLCEWGLAILLLITTAVQAAVGRPATPGMTGDLPHQRYVWSDTRLASAVPVGPLCAPAGALDEWQPLASTTTAQSLWPGQCYAFRLDGQSRTMTEIAPEHALSPLCLEAIDRAPRWLRADLRDNFLQFGEMGFLAEVMAQLILTAEDPVVDEVAFTMAHLSPSLLISGQMMWDRDLALIVENAQGVYDADAFLPYVRIHDYGDSGADNYWSTAQYTIRLANGDTTQIEIAPDVYYWYVVHPRISDEAPRYVSPLTGGAAAPPAGRFWRQFYLEEPDSGYRSLHDMLDSCSLAYGNLFNNNTDDNGAVGVVTRWIQDVMDFGSGTERPIQPVRIYHLHLGRCGEHQDITAAAARAALIPAVGTTALCNDHVWNEFWDGFRWKQWEPVNNYVGDSLSYQGWGKHFAALFNWRGDGFVWTVTQRYHSRTTTLTVRVTDAIGEPVDGAKIRVLGDYEYGGLQLATVGYTNCTGQVTFPIGGERNIYINVASALGTYPPNPNNGTLIIENSSVDSVYTWTFAYPDTLHAVRGTLPLPVPEPTNHFRFVAEYQTLRQAVHSQIFQYSDFVACLDRARLDFFICDEANYQAFVAGASFSAYESCSALDSGVISFTLPDDGIWYAVFHNSNSIASIERFAVQAEFSVDSELPAGERPGTAPEYALLPNYPNPFNALTSLRFSLAQRGATRLLVYGVDGRLAYARDFGVLDAGTHEAQLDFSRRASGVYFYTLESRDFRATGKLLLLK